MMTFEPGERVRVSTCLEGWEASYVGQVGNVLSQSGEWVDVGFDATDASDYYCFNVEELEKIT